MFSDFTIPNFLIVFLLLNYIYAIYNRTMCNWVANLKDLPNHQLRAYQSIPPLEIMYLLMLYFHYL